MKWKWDRRAWTRGQQLPWVRQTWKGYYLHVLLIFLNINFLCFFFSKRTVQRSRSLMEKFPLISCLSHRVCHPPSSPFLLRTVSLLIFVEWIENCKKIIKTFQRHPTLSGFRISWALWPLYIGPARGLCIRSGNSVTIVSCHNLKSSGSLIWLKLKTNNFIR